MSDWYKRAEELSGLGDSERALPFAERAVSEDPQAWQNWCSLSRALAGLARHGEALGAAERALALEPEAEWAHRLRSRALGALGRRSEAIDAAREAVAIRPDESQAWAQLAETAAHLGFGAEARRAAERAVGLAPEDANRWLTLSYVCIGVDWDESLRASERALQLKPEHPMAINNLGWARLAQGQAHEARELFDRAIRIAPAEPRWLFNRAIATGLLEGREAGTSEFLRAREVALARVERQIAEKPHNAMAHAGRAAMLRGLGAEPDVVLESARRSVSLDRNLAYGWQELREAAAVAGRWQLARYAARRAIEADPSAPDRWLVAGDIAHHAGRPAEAASWANRVVNEASESRSLPVAKGLLRFLDGDFENALTLAREDLLARARLSCCHHVFVAACCIELGDERGAQEALEQAELRRPTCGCFRRQRVKRLLPRAGA